MNIIQFETRNQQRAVGAVENNTVKPINHVTTTRDLALLAINNNLRLDQQIEQLGFASEHYDYAELLENLQVLAPLDHPDTAHCFVSGTGLTHLGSAATRDKMHQTNLNDTASVTDTMRIFQWGIEQGKPAAGKIGAQPEWFYKGDGSIVVRPGEALPLPPCRRCWRRA